MPRSNLLARLFSAEVKRLNEVVIPGLERELDESRDAREAADLRAQECAQDYALFKDASNRTHAALTTERDQALHGRGIALGEVDYLRLQLATRPTAAAPQWFEDAYRDDGMFNRVWHPFLLQRPEVRPVILDRAYWLPTPQQFEAMRQHWISLPAADLSRFTDERADCDDYAIGFAAMCRNEFGINGVAWVANDATGLHSYNAVVFPGDAEPRFFEPQGSTFVTLRDTGLYQLKHGVVVI